MQFKINGKPEIRETETTVAVLLESLEIHPARVAVEINDRFVRREDYASTLIQEGDRLEIVKMIGGGA